MRARQSVGNFDEYYHDSSYKNCFVKVPTWISCVELGAHWLQPEAKPTCNTVLSLLVHISLSHACIHVPRNFLDPRLDHRDLSLFLLQDLRWMAFLS